MKLLLDTHIWLWSLSEPARLKRPVAQALENKSNELWLSPLSLWEVVLLAERERITLSQTQRWLATALEIVRPKEAPLTSEVVLATKDIQLAHRDLVDLFLASTARVFELTLVTADPRLLSGKGFAVMPNR